MENFEKLYKNINNFLSTNKNNKEKYNEYFLSSVDRKDFGYNQIIRIPPTHYNKKNLWLIKPVNFNRGRGIIVENNMEKIVSILKDYNNKREIIIDEKDKESVTPARYVILQKYIEKPLLYNQRKFDIRIWIMIIGDLPNYVFIFKEGHLKATCDKYDLNNNNSFTHLTNYSVQKYHKKFSTVEKGNEISYKSFQNFLDKKKTGINYRKDIYPKICNIIKLSVNSVKGLINVGQRKKCFEIFGCDFLIDEKYNPFLIEVNTNPGLEISSPLISILLPRMIDDCFKLTIDTMDGKNEEKSSPKVTYHVDGYKDTENMWEKFNIYS